MECPKCQSKIGEDSHYCSKCGSQVTAADGASVSFTKTLQTPSKGVRIGSTFAERYRIVDELGRGGMGVVYKAEDLRLERNVALKFLPPELTQDEEAKERFVLEARAAAAISHPNICTIHEIDEFEDQTFIAMEFIEGESLRDRVKKVPIAVDETLNIAIQVANGLEEAHKKGIIHRDIKSANIMVTPGGQAKIMDFGLAKVSGSVLITQEGVTLGTVAYMSPEQARGDKVDQRTDIWSLGIVLYEMLSGQLPFWGDKEASILYNIEHKDPLPIRKLKGDIPIELEKIINRSLKKKPESRYQSAGEVLTDLQEYQDFLKAPELGITDFKSFVRVVKRPKIAIPTLLTILVIGLIAVWYFNRSAKIGWARKEALPEIIRLVEEDNYTAAFKLALQAEKYIPEDPLLIEQWPKMSGEVSILTTPPEADVYMRDYNAIEGEWEYLGQTPIESLRIPNSLFRWKIEKEGYRPVERAAINFTGSLHCQLDEEGSIPPDMIRVQGGEYLMRLPRIPFQEPVQLGDFLIDEYEVTNKKFKEFVEGGGYRNQKYWNHKFIKDGQILSWEEAMAEFRDTTGRPGPATWEIGTYPEGQDDYPVTGISWYEAAAYAEFAGKSLPTIYHWTWVAGLYRASSIVPLSNFGGSGVAPVGSYQGMSPYGNYDMAGNVKEWCWNESEGVRYIMGGAWNEPSYFFYFPYVQSPFDRSASNGFRCIKNIPSEETSGKTVQPLLYPSPRDFSKEKPVSDDIFNIFRGLYSYDKTELDPVIESTDETSSHWIKERITFNAAYGNERMMAYLFLPKNYAPPYQTVIFFPGLEAMYTRSSEELYVLHFIIQSGRAFLYPVYKSTYERGDDFRVETATAASSREHLIMWSKDFQRSIDYLETRTDISHDKLAYYGASWGASFGPYLLALENRIKTGVLHAGGFDTYEVQPETDQINYVPRVKIPILMLNGRYDYLFPLEESVLPMYRLLGTPEEHKHLVVFDSGHSIDSYNRNKLIKEVLDWLDRYLGPVE
ncbi:MAG: protein kinase [Candidatus Aminicenantaceae bacterium]